MKGKNSLNNFRMMFASAVVTVLVLVLVFVGFVLLHRDQEIKAALTADFETESSEAMEDTVKSGVTGTAERIKANVYLLHGEEKSSNKFARTDKLMYTDSVKYTKSDLDNLDEYGLRLTRNEVYARHGRMFNDKDLQDYFDEQYWYVAEFSPGEFDDSCLNDVEKANISMITRCEQER
jgi:preprotein translocase subunit SecG